MIHLCDASLLGFFACFPHICQSIPGGQVSYLIKVWEGYDLPCDDSQTEKCGNDAEGKCDYPSRSEASWQWSRCHVGPS
jgi:hypothetical protein